MDAFNNREVASALWIIVFACYVFFASKFEGARKSFKDLVSAFFARQIISILILMSAYMTLVIYVMYGAGLWNVGQIKNTLYWAGSVGLMSIFKLETIKKDNNYFSQLAFGSLKIFAIIQFIVGIYTFPLWVELLIVPVFVLIGGMSVIADKVGRYSQVKNLFNSMLIIFSLAVIINAFYMIVFHWGEFANESTVYDFIVPALLTLFYIPFLFVLKIYIVYESAFIKIKFLIKNKKVRLLAKIYSVLFFNFRTAQFDRWIKCLSIDKVNSHQELVKSFKHISKMNRLDNGVCEVPISEGWFPYIAKDFLTDEGFITGFYSKSYGNEWSASSPMMKLGNEILPDNIAYYVEGVEGIAKKLKLSLNINDSSRAILSRKKFMETAGVLIQKSLNMNITDATKHALLCGESHYELYENKAVSVAVNLWPRHKSGGHDMKFTVAND